VVKQVALGVPASGSFRDPSGQVYLCKDHIQRTIQASYAPHWQAMESSGFIDEAVKAGLLLEYSEAAPLEYSWKTINSPKLPCITYPYEWSFSQLKDAALHTLKIMKLALSHGLILKDATAYNIQFTGTKPVFIDHLSFEIRNEQAPWAAYLQFCKHFLVPLVLMKYVSPDCGKLSSLWIDGVPLEFASALLPFKTRLSPSLQIHIHLHSRMLKKHSDARKSAHKAKSLRMKEHAASNLCEALRMTIESLSLPARKTEWGDYYNDTNYTERAAADKMNFIRKIVSTHEGKLAVDMGANTGLYSRLLADNYACVLAVDVDYMAVEKHYLALKSEGHRKIIPLVIDLSNPSPAIGWASKERDAFNDRCNADAITALALIHHLVLSIGIPLEKTAVYFHSLIRCEGLLILEFVPLEDSQVQRLLAARNNVFTDYSIQKCISEYSRYFDLLEQHQVSESLRTILVFRKRAS
jgi:hypothetical protein